MLISSTITLTTLFVSINTDELREVPTASEYTWSVSAAGMIRTVPAGDVAGGVLIGGWGERRRHPSNGFRRCEGYLRDRRGGKCREPIGLWARTASCGRTEKGF